MALRDTLKLFVPKFLWNLISHPAGYVITPEEYNNQHNLNVAQGDASAQAIADTLTMLYETVLHDTDAGPHINIAVANYAATTLKAALEEVRTKIVNDITTVTNAATGIQNQVTADVLALATHKTSADHDARYYTEAEVNAIQGALQTQLNTNASTLTAVQNTLATLNDTFSTDAERVAAIMAVVSQFQIADGDLNTLIINKADAASVYTKAQIDAMTLGSYKFGFFNDNQVMTTPTTTVTVNIPEWNPPDDPLQVFVGGLFQTEGVDFSINSVNKTITSLTGVYDTGFVIDFFVIKNIRVVAPGDYVDGSLILADSIYRTSLAPAIRAELSLKPDYKVGTDNFVTGLTQVVTDAFITADTFVTVTPTGTKVGMWTVTSTAGSFTITSDTSETNCAFDWNALKAGI